MTNMLEDLSVTAKQVDQWFSKLVSVIPQNIYAPLNNVSAPSDDVEHTSKVKGTKRKDSKSKRSGKINKKMKNKSQQKSLEGSTFSAVEEQTSYGSVAVSEEKSQVSDIAIPLDAKLQTILAKTRGEKVRDDPKFQKRRLKERERKKRKSKREWSERKKAQEEKQKTRQQMREQNIQKRKMKRKIKTKKSR
ncbi:hypothetical protein GpartN1_g6191.t1 [Galdieria partita]|uniref:Ribosomal RNA-processing protein 14/surfeit locus protein 6 C-terminal domain-containing protein n=1 Tax=Galdieria partita TaxID=83374 RepID=A0A9C7Q1Y7_9RHOD|nr:hypothetical protein GpartN1_g6191.t1 [Galdieria partita]